MHELFIKVSHQKSLSHGIQARRSRILNRHSHPQEIWGDDLKIHILSFPMIFVFHCESLFLSKIRTCNPNFAVPREFSFRLTAGFCINPSRFSHNKGRRILKGWCITMEERNEGMPLWTAINDVPALYPWLFKEETCDVCVIGGGVTGALCALRLASSGVDTVLISGGPIGYGATAACSGSMRFDVAGGLRELSAGIGIDQAVRVYHMCEEAITSLERLTSSLEADCGFYRTDGLLFTCDENSVEDLRKEYLLRRHNGFEVEFLRREQEKDAYSFPMAAGILSKSLAAAADPYRLAHAVAAAAQKAGARIYENTTIEHISGEEGPHILRADTRRTVTAGTVVLAIGRETLSFLRGCGSRRTSFSVATAPVGAFSGWPDRCVIHSADHPEVTFSVTPEGRILASGLETGLIDRNRRMAGLLPADALAAKKYRHLEDEICEMFPGIRETDAEYGFMGDYLETDDGLPLIGSHPEYPNCFFALCGGENGILFSEIAANLIVDLCRGNTPETADLFSPQR